MCRRYVPKGSIIATGADVGQSVVTEGAGPEQYMDPRY